MFSCTHPVCAGEYPFLRPDKESLGRFGRMKAMVPHIICGNYRPLPHVSPFQRSSGYSKERSQQGAASLAGGTRRRMFLATSRGAKQWWP